MTKVRQLSKRNPLYIEKHAFWSAYHFALQYPDWKRQYAEAMAQTLKAVDYNDMPHGSTTGDPTPRIAMRTSTHRTHSGARPCGVPTLRRDQRGRDVCLAQLGALPAWADTMRAHQVLPDAAIILLPTQQEIGRTRHN